MKGVRERAKDALSENDISRTIASMDLDDIKALNEVITFIY